MSEKEELKYWLALSRVKGLGSKSISRLMDYFDNPVQAWQADSNELDKVNGLYLAGKDIKKQVAKMDPDHILAELKRKGIKFVCRGEKNYPGLLEEISDPPPVIYFRGRYDFTLPGVALVGTRSCSAYGKRIAERMAYKLVQRNIAVISGLARGIDTRAHQGVLRGGGKTVAVLGSGVDQIYPRQNEELAREIEEQGLILSEFPPGTKPEPGNFPRRNRIISGLARATVVIEAPKKSGALITAQKARQQNRKVFAVPGNIDRETSQGCHKLIKQGAKPLFSIEDLLSEVFLSNQKEDLESEMVSDSEQRSEKIYPKLSKKEKKIIKQLEREGELHINEISELCEISVRELNSILLKLELKGLVSGQPGKKFSFRGLQNLLKPI